MGAQARTAKQPNKRITTNSNIKREREKKNVYVESSGAFIVYRASKHVPRCERCALCYGLHYKYIYIKKIVIKTKTDAVLGGTRRTALYARPVQISSRTPSHIVLRTHYVCIVPVRALRCLFAPELAKKKQIYNSCYKILIFPSPRLDFLCC